MMTAMYGVSCDGEGKGPYRRIRKAGDKRVCFEMSSSAASHLGDVMFGVGVGFHVGPHGMGAET